MTFPGNLIRFSCLICRHSTFRSIQRTNSAIINFSTLKTKQNVSNLQLCSDQNISCNKNYSRYATNKCWNCDADIRSLNELFCNKCQVLQNPPNNQNYFEVFNLPQQFELDQKELTKTFRSLQAVLHPDKFSNRSEKEKIVSAEYSSLVNKAYSTLQTPLKRAIYMLSLNDEKIDEKNEVTDQEFLMEIMEVNEEIDEADTPDKLKKLDQKNKKVLKSITEEVSKCFGTKNIANAKKCIIRMKYYDSVNSRINHLLREKGIVD